MMKEWWEEEDEGVFKRMWRKIREWGFVEWFNMVAVGLAGLALVYVMVFAFLSAFCI